jgi:hypothetical protein
MLTNPLLTSYLGMRHDEQRLPAPLLYRILSLTDYQGRSSTLSFFGDVPLQVKSRVLPGMRVRSSVAASLDPLHEKFGLSSAPQ